jgi:hypothetical protein
MRVNYTDQTWHTCYHEAAHAVYATCHPVLELRDVEVSLEPGDGRWDITRFSGVPLFLDSYGAMGMAVLAFVGEYAVYRAFPDDPRTGYMPFEEFMYCADPEEEFDALDEYDNPFMLLEERSRYLKGEGECDSLYDGDDRDALVDLRLAAGLARTFVDQVPELQIPEHQIPYYQDMLRWRDLPSCYEDATQAAFDFIDNLWPEIEAVAEALHSKGKLSGPEFVAVIDRVKRGEE